LRQKAWKRLMRPAAACLLALVMLAGLPLSARATGFEWQQDASKRVVRLDMSDGRVVGMGWSYEFLVPALWKEHVFVERQLGGLPSYIIDNLSFYCKSATGVSSPLLLMSLYTIDKKEWSDSLPYTPVLFGRDLVFVVVFGAEETSFSHPFDQALFRSCRSDVQTAEKILELLKLSERQQVPNQLTVFVNDKKMTNPVVFLGSTYYVPLREVCEALGYKVVWSQKTASTTISKGSFADTIPVKSNMVADKRGYKMRMIEGRVYVSVAYLYSVFNAVVEVDDIKNVYVITY